MGAGAAVLSREETRWARAKKATAGQAEQQGREEWRTNLAQCDPVRHRGPLARGRIVGVLDQRADGEPYHAHIGGVEHHERADREPADRRGPARQVANHAGAGPWAG
jgi:hypothetical protein